LDALKVAKERQFKKLERDIYQELESLYKIWKDFKKAYDYLDKYTFIKDSLDNIDSERRFKVLQGDFDVEKKNRENEKLRKENFYRQRNTLIQAIIFIFIILFLLMITFINNYRSVKILKKKNIVIEHQGNAFEILNKQLSKQNQQLKLLDKEKDDAIKIVSHDLKAPFDKILGLLEVLRLEYKSLPEGMNDYFMKIKQVSEDATETIKRLLDIKAIQNNKILLNYERINCKDVLEAIVQSFYVLADKKNIQIHLVTSGDNFELYTDKYYFIRIFDNLLSNAIKFSNNDKKIQINIMKDRQQLVFKIQDEGQGIEEEDQKKLFQSFQRLSTRPTGGESSTGLGLSIVKQIVDKLGAKIWFESKIKVGTTFYVSFLINEKHLS